MDAVKAGCILSKFFSREAMLTFAFNTSCTRLVRFRMEAFAQSSDVL